MNTSLPPQALAKSPTPSVHVSVGELFDKKSILEIKAEKLSNPNQHANVMRELAYLNGPCKTLAQACRDLGELQRLLDELKNINTRLWDLENRVRQLSRAGNFSNDFVNAARHIFTGNDERARIKHAINLLMDSWLIEEKFHA